MTQLLNISAEDAEEYSQSLAKIGEGWVEQVVWAFRQGIPEAMGMSRLEWRRKYYGHLKIGDIDERQETAKKLASEGMNNSQIADALGVDKATVSRDLNGNPEPEPEPEVANATPDVESDPLVEVNEPEPEPEVANATPELATAPESPPRVNEGDEWYTPPWLFKALGIHFALDVCAPLDRTYSAVPADGHLTIEDDGLAQPWTGTVWCNPPYSKPEPWARRMIHHGDGLLLTHIPMNAAWCVDVWETCDAIRLFQAMEFVRPDGTSQRPGYWLQLAAFGPAATEALARLQPLGDAAFNKRRVASPMWRRAS